MAQDQLVAVQNLLSSCPELEVIQVAAYDGDTPQEARRRCPAAPRRLPSEQRIGQIRENASIMFTNFVRNFYKEKFPSLTSMIVGHASLFDPSS